MPTFSYKARTSSGQTIKDTISAVSLTEAQARITSQGLTILWVREPEKKKRFQIGGSIPTIEKANLCRYLATMVKAGLSLPEAIEVFAKDTKNSKLKQILYDCQVRIQQGSTLSETLAQYPKVFNNIIIALIKAGEVSGTLNKSLEYLSDYLYAQYHLKQKVKGALMYPFIITAAMLGVGMILIFFVIPRMAPVFLQIQVKLPLMTRVLLETGVFISDNSIIILPGLALMVVALGLFLTRPTGRKIALMIIRIIPAVRQLLNYLDLARFCRTLSTLLNSGVPITQALQSVTTALSQDKFRHGAAKLYEEVQQGTNLSDSLRNRPNLFPAMTVRMIATGEKTGTVEEMLAQTADYYEREVDNLLHNFSSIIEPVLLLMIGVAVAIMVIAVVAPIYSLVGGIQAS
jgi:type II secretory pathway component PulF